jgi:hypothetical protein
LGAFYARPEIFSMPGQENPLEKQKTPVRGRFLTLNIPGSVTPTHLRPFCNPAKHFVVSSLHEGCQMDKRKRGVFPVLHEKISYKQESIS